MKTKLTTLERQLQVSDFLSFRNRKATESIGEEIKDSFIFPSRYKKLKTIFPVKDINTVGINFLANGEQTYWLGFRTESDGAYHITAMVRGASSGILILVCTSDWF